MSDPKYSGEVSTARNLLTRVLSAIVLAPLAVAVAWFGAWPFALFWTIAAIAVLFEWTTLAAGASAHAVVVVGAIGIGLAASIHQMGQPAVALLVVVLSALAALLLAPTTRRLWLASGSLYAALLMIAPLYLRADVEYGFAAIVLIFAVVWTTDVLGYFGGRAFGGPKLAPAVSPKKTWSGALSGTAGAALAAMLWVLFFQHGSIAAVITVAILLSVFAQIGDLAESALKRHFGVKDASQLIPGHGGVMDRLDGFWAAAVLAALIGLARGGSETPARDLLIW